MIPDSRSRTPLQLLGIGIRNRAGAHRVQTSPLKSHLYHQACKTLTQIVRSRSRASDGAWLHVIEHSDGHWRSWLPACSLAARNCKAARHRHPHMFRQTRRPTAGLPQQPVAPEKLCRVMPCSIRITEIYAHVLPGRLDRAIDAVNLGPKTAAEAAK